MFQDLVFGTSNCLIILQFLGFVAMALRSKCTELQVNILNNHEIVKDRVFLLYTGFRTVKSFFETFLFWLSLFVYM